MRNDVKQLISVLVLVDHAIGNSGPHRHVVSSLNALSVRPEIDLRLLTGQIEDNEPYASRSDIQIGFEPHNKRKIVHNLRLLRNAIKDRDLIYVPTGLKSFLYAFATKGKRKLVAGPNVTGIPLLMNPANPSPLMTTRMSDAWIETSIIRVQECISAGTLESDIRLVPHCVDTNKFNPIYRENEIWETVGINAQSIKVIYTGHLDTELKGVPIIIEAFQRLRVLAPLFDIDLILLGGGAYASTEEQRTASNIHFLGKRTGIDFVRLLASADIFLGASRYETFWFAPLEAMACGLPVVVSTAGAVPTMIPENGIQGRMVQIIDSNNQYLPDAAQRLADAMLPLVKNEDQRRKMGRSARAHVQAHFSENRLGENLQDVFRNVLSASR